MIGKGTTWKRAASAPSEFPRRIRIDSVGRNMIFAHNAERINEEHILSRLDLVKFYRREKTVEEAIPEAFAQIKAANALADQSIKPYTGFINHERKPKQRRIYETLTRLSDDLHFIFNGRVWA